MPTYDYLCPSCGARYTSFRGISDESPSLCPACGTEARRQISAGGGFLIKKSGGQRTACGSDVPCCGRGEPCGGSGGCSF